MKKKNLTLLIIFFGTAILYFHDEILSFFENVQIYAEGGHKEVFEINLTAEQTMNLRRSELLKDSAHTYHKTTLMLSPHILFETKFVDEKEKPKESLLLWSAVNGEIVLDTEPWTTTHGYRDALTSGADEEDFRLLYALAKRNGAASKEQLQKDTGLESFQKTANKNLIVLAGNTVKLHMEEPQILTLPASRIKHALVTREVNFDSLITKNFSLGKIQKAAKASFGKNFTIRSSKEVFLPVWKIDVKKPDGSLSTSYWNAVTGARAPVPR